MIAIVPVDSPPQGIDIHPDTGRVYVTNGAANTVSVIDPASNTVTATIPLSAANPGAGGIAVHAQASRLYVASGQNTVSVVDLATNTFTASIPVGSSPIWVAVDTRSGDVYVTNQRGRSVSVIDSTTNTVVATIPVGQKPSSIMVQPIDEGFVYVVNEIGQSVSVIDPATRTVNATVPVGVAPGGIAGGWPLNGEIYVAVAGDSAAGTVAAIDSRDNSVESFPVPPEPFGVATSVPAGQAYLTHSTANLVSVIDPATRTVTGTTAVGKSPRAIAVNQRSGRVYVANSGDNTVSVLDR